MARMSVISGIHFLVRSRNSRDFDKILAFRSFPRFYLFHLYAPSSHRHHRTPPQSVLEDMSRMNRYFLRLQFSKSQGERYCWAVGRGSHEATAGTNVVTGGLCGFSRPGGLSMGNLHSSSATVVCLIGRKFDSWGGMQ